MVASHRTCDDMRLSSHISIRIHVARSGISRPRSFSVANEKTSSLNIGDT